MKKYNYILLVIILIKHTNIFSQDPQFSQFYSVPLYLAPSFAGNTAGSRVATNYRLQWPEIPGAYQTFATSFDHFYPELRSGVGFLFIRDQAGSGRLSSTNAGFQYSYSFNITRQFEFRPGIHFYLSQRKIDVSRMTFGDQLFWETLVSQDEYITNRKESYFDAAFSLLGYTKRYWLGFKADHLLTPNQSLMNGESTVPRLYNFFGGYKFSTNKRWGRYDEESITITYLYKSQALFDQFDIGAYFTKQPLIIGFWYRGIPFIKAYKQGYHNNDALVILAGYKIEDLSIGYSYDFTISRLINNTGGSHELAIIFLFNQNQKIKKKSRHIIVDCPKF